MYQASSSRYQSMPYHSSGASVLVGASKPSQILDNISAVNNTVFTDEEQRIIDEIAMR
jgi:aryl-alcohol dehydrogenase-like predicted oxidoreductase